MSLLLTGYDVDCPLLKFKGEAWSSTPGELEGEFIQSLALQARTRKQSRGQNFESAIMPDSFQAA